MFQRLTRAVVDRDLKASKDSNFFKPGKPIKDQLVGVGILGKHANLNMSVHVSAPEATEVAKSLLKLNRTISARHADEFLRGARDLQPHALKLNGKAGWDSNLRVVQNQSNCNNEWDVHSLSNVPHQGGITFYKCPKPNCGKAEPSSVYNFQSRDLDMPNRCTHCKGYSPVRAWTCQCDKPWYTCQGQERKA